MLVDELSRQRDHEQRQSFRRPAKLRLTSRSVARSVVAHQNHGCPLQHSGLLQLLQPRGKVLVEPAARCWNVLRRPGDKRERKSRDMCGVAGRQKLFDVTEHVLVLGQRSQTSRLGRLSWLQVGRRLPEWTHVMVDGRLLKAIEVRVEQVATDQSVLGVQRHVTSLLELVPDKWQGVDEVGVLATDTLIRQFRESHT